MEAPIAIDRKYSLIEIRDQGKRYEANTYDNRYPARPSRVDSRFGLVENSEEPAAKKLEGTADRKKIFFLKVKLEYYLSSPPKKTSWA